MARTKSLDEEQLTDANYYILLALVTPIHGYGIMQKILEISTKEVTIGPASLYTSLKKLQNANLINLLEDNENRKKVYSLTNHGKEILKKDLKRRIKMVEQGKIALKEMGEI